MLYFILLRFPNFRLNKWNICSTNCCKTYENLKFTISKLRSESKMVLIHFIRKNRRIFSNFHTKNMCIWKPLYEKSHNPPKYLTFRSDGSGLRILVSFSIAFGTEKKEEVSMETWAKILLYNNNTLFYVYIILWISIRKIKSTKNDIMITKFSKNKSNKSNNEWTWKPYLKNSYYEYELARNLATRNKNQNIHSRFFV